MHRSGTSSIAGSLHSAGLYPGGIILKSSDQPFGNRENPQIFRLNKKILQFNESTWDSPPLTELKWNDELRKERDLIISRMERQDSQWMFKDPRTLFTIPFWQEGLPELQFIGTFRHPLRVAVSLYRRSKFSIRDGLELWLKYNSRLLELITK